jgi:ribosome-binding protein aMBF1 (putative translation factor)
MDTKKKETIMKCNSFEELLTAEYGERGTEARESFETNAEAFCLAECLKEQRRLAGLTQEQLAAKIGTKKSYISKIENGLITPSVGVFYRIINALGMRVEVVKPIY